MTLALHPPGCWDSKDGKSLPLPAREHWGAIRGLATCFCLPARYVAGTSDGSVNPRSQGARARPDSAHTGGFPEAPGSGLRTAGRGWGRHYGNSGILGTGEPATSPPPFWALLSRQCPPETRSPNDASGWLGATELREAPGDHAVALCPGPWEQMPGCPHPAGFGLCPCSSPGPRGSSSPRLSQKSSFTTASGHLGPPLAQQGQSLRPRNQLWGPFPPALLSCRSKSQPCHAETQLPVPPLPRPQSYLPLGTCTTTCSYRLSGSSSSFLCSLLRQRGLPGAAACLLPRSLGGLARQPLWAPATQNHRWTCCLLRCSSRARLCAWHFWDPSPG